MSAECQYPCHPPWRSRLPGAEARSWRATRASPPRQWAEEELQEADRRDLVHRDLALDHRELGRRAEALWNLPRAAGEETPPEAAQRTAAARKTWRPVA